MTDQFQPDRLARGVKATVQHVFTPIATVVTSALAASIAQTHCRRAFSRTSWVLPWVGSESVTIAGYPVVVWPFVMPPFQQLFTRATLEIPDYQVLLTELSLSFDTRGEALGITDTENVDEAGRLTACEMSRYDMVLTLNERKPWQLSLETESYNEVLRIDISGDGVFGSFFSRANPLLIQKQDVPIKPFSVYFWKLEVPGLFTLEPTTKAYLALVSLNLTATWSSPLTVRDHVSDFSAAPGIQNMPTAHDGNKVGTTIAVTNPAANDLMTGTDIQDGLHALDTPLLRGAPSGYGPGFGALANTPQAADPPPEELLENDAHYCMIAVPMFSGLFLNAIRAGDVTGGYLPFTTSPGFINPSFDERQMPVPDNFVLHHAFAVDSVFLPYSSLHAPLGEESSRSLSDHYVQKVGVIIQSGWQGEEARLQNAAYVTWTGGPDNATLLDRFDVSTASNVIAIPCYDLRMIPLVSSAPSTVNSWFSQGQPFFMGKANNKTQTRSQTATVAGVAQTPATKGREQLVVVRWSKQDATSGLQDVGDRTAVRAGQGGSWVILCGKLTLGA